MKIYVTRLSVVRKFFARVQFQSDMWYPLLVCQLTTLFCSELFVQDGGNLKIGKLLPVSPPNSPSHKARSNFLYNGSLQRDIHAIFIPEAFFSSMYIGCSGLEVLRVVIMKSFVFCDITPCSPTNRTVISQEIELYIRCFLLLSRQSLI
jgi:hypothetical protein